MSTMLLLLLLVSSDSKLETIEVKAQRAPVDQSVMEDVCSHASKVYGLQGGRNTNAHETCHQICSDVRNSLFNKRKGRFNAFYLMGSKACVVDEPGITIGQIIPFIDRKFVGTRYSTYFVTQLREWNDTPLYICDEWNAYIAGGESAVWDFENGIANDNRKDVTVDGVSGCLEFSIYVTALAMAIKKHDLEYYKTNTQFHAFLKHNLKRAQAVYFKHDKLCWNQRELLTRLREDKVMSDFLTQDFDGAWVK